MFVPKRHLPRADRIVTHATSRATVTQRIRTLHKQLMTTLSRRKTRVRENIPQILADFACYPKLPQHGVDLKDAQASHRSDQQNWHQ